MNLISLKKSVVLCLLSAMVFFGSCQWLTVEPVEIDIPDVVSFTTDIQPILSNKCVTCHTATNPVLTSAAAYNSLINGNYVNTADPASSTIVVKTNTGHGGLTPGEKALLFSWIEQGALNN